MLAGKGRIDMDIFRRWRAKKPAQAEPPAPKTDRPVQQAPAGQDAELVGLLQRMIAEEPALSEFEFDLDKLRRSVDIRERHAQTIRSMGSAIIPGLCRALSHADPEMRRQSCWALQILGESGGLTTDALLAMAGLIGDRDPKVREQAPHSLGLLAAKHNLAPVVPQLLAGLKSADAKVRKATADVLGKIGPAAAAALDALRSMLRDPDVDVAEAARAAITKIGGKVEAPAAGSAQEAERLARLTASSDTAVRDKAWKDLEKLADREAAIEPLMKVFRSVSARGAGTNLPKFLGNLGTDACRAPLLEILDRTRGSSDAWEQKYMAGSACVALLKGGAGSLRSVVPPVLLQFIMTRGLMSADDRERPLIVGTLTADERRNTIAELMSFFGRAQDKDECAWTVSRALGSLGLDALEPLLEVLRSVKPSKMQPNGYIGDKERGGDGPPASALVRIPGGLEKLRATCSAEEYARILVLAHSYGDSSNPALNRALGEVTTPEAIGRLVFVLWQDHWQAEMRRPAREALVQAGKKAHEQLLKALARKVPANREFQTSLRREVLAVLHETGDEACIPAIQEVLASDPAVAAEAKAALEAIAERGGMELPQVAAAEALPLKRIARTGDPYVDDCFQMDFDELYDERDWFKMPEAKAIPAAANVGRQDEASRLAAELTRTHPDFYFGYYWLAVLYRKQKRYDDARQALLEGLRQAKSKQDLCDGMAEMEWERHNLPEAVKWWIKSVALQVGSQYATDYVPFLYLSYVAEALGIQVACSKLRSWVDSIRSGQLRLDAQAANALYSATSSQGTAAIRRAIELLLKHYLSSREE
jgi:HEAT repeat protein